MSHNTWFHKVSRVIIVNPLVKTRITPNQLTLVRLVSGLSAAGAMMVGSNTWLNIGAGLFIFSMLLDRADGDLARITEQMSFNGHKLDLISDASCNSLIFVGLGFGLANSSLGMWAIPMGVISGLAIAAILLLVVQIESTEGAGAAELDSFAGFDPDDIIILVPIAILLGWSKYILMAAAIGAPTFLLIFIYMFRHTLKFGKINF